MPTALERAQEQEARKLRQQGFNPDGTRIDAGDGGGGGDPGDGGDHDDDDDRGDRGDPDDGDDGMTREELIAELAKRERELEAANGRAAPTQRQADEYKEMWQTAERARQQADQDRAAEIQALREQLEANRPAFDPKSLLSSEEQERFDPETLAMVIKVAEGIAKAHTPTTDPRATTLQVLEEREKAKVLAYRNKVLTDPSRGLHQLAELSYDPAFQAWSKEEDNDMESVVNSLLHAQSTEDVDRFAKIVSRRVIKFKERKDKPTDVRTSLQSGMRRGGKAKLTAEESQAKLNEAKRLARSRNPADRAQARKLIDEIQ